MLKPGIVHVTRDARDAVLGGTSTEGTLRLNPEKCQYFNVKEEREGNRAKVVHLNETLLLDGFLLLLVTRLYHWKCQNLVAVFTQ